MQVKLDDLNNNYDYVIIGAGIIGFTLLRELLEDGKKNILIIDSGSMLSKKPYPKSFEVKSDSYKIKKTALFSGVGGCSNVWGTICAIFDKKTINKYYKKKKFPLNYNKYIFYLRKVALKYNLPNIEEFQSFKLSSDIFKAKKFIKVKPNLKFFNFSSILENENVHFLQNTTVTKIINNDNLKSILFKTESKPEIVFKVSGKKIILSANTIQNFKILAASDTFKKHKKLGKGFMNHPKGVIGSIKKKKIFEKFLTKSLDNKYTYLGLQCKYSKFNHYLKIEEGIKFPFLNFLTKDITENIYKYNGKIYGFKNYLFEFLRIALNITEKLFDKFFSNHYHLTAYLEIKNNDNNKMTYDEQTKNVNVDYKLCEKGVNELINLISKFEKEFKTKISFKPKSKKSLIKYTSLDSSHHMGGIECGLDSGVVDLNLCLHNTNNIYLCGGGIFPFSSVENPTYSYMALAIWLSKEVL